MSEQDQEAVLSRLRTDPATTGQMMFEQVAGATSVPAAVGALLKLGRIRVRGHINMNGNGDRVPVFALTLNSKAEEGNW